MGSKWFKKSDLTYKNGYLSDASGNIVMLPKAVHEALEGLEYLVQMGEYKTKVAMLKAMPKIPEFEQKHITSNFVEMKMPETPTLDAAIKEAMTIIDEIDSTNNVRGFQIFLDRNPALANFIVSDEFVAELDAPTQILDTPKIGNPLELTIDSLHTLFEIAEL